MQLLIKSGLESLILKFSNPDISFNKSLSLETETDGTEGTWYILPSQHAIELLFSTILCVLLAYWGFRNLLNDKKQYVKQSVKYQKLNKKATLLESVATISVLISYCFMFLHKYQRGQLSYIIQFCHFHLGILLVCLLLPKSWFLPHLLYNIELYTVYGTLLALLMPDTRGINLIFEMKNFYLEHYLLLIVPFIMMFSGRYSTWSFNLPTLALALCQKYFLISIFSTLLALKLGTNLNYALSPPPGILEEAGHYFKLVTMLLSVGLSLFSRVFIVESGSLLIRFLLKFNNLFIKKEGKIE